MLSTRDPGTTHGISAVDIGMLFLGSYPEITEFPATEDLDGYKEVRLNYYLVEGSDSLTAEQVQTYLVDNQKVPANADLKVERVKPGSRSLIKRVFTRYRIGSGSDVRLNPVAIDYIYMEE